MAQLHDANAQIEAALAEAAPPRELALALQPGEPIPTSLIALTELDTLHLSCPGRLELPRWFGRMRGLISLEVDARLDAIPAFLSEIDTLERLSLRSDGGFEPALAKLPRLRELELELGALVDAPLDLIERTWLETVRVRARELVGVPLGLLVAPNLRSLTLEAEAAPLRPAFPRMIPGLRRLDELALRGWPLAAIPRALVQLPALSSLVLRGCGLTSLPDDWGECAGGLARLDVSDNELVELPASLAALSRLRSLLAASNPIRRVDPALASLTELERLDLDDTALDDLPAAIRALPKLRALSLTQTRATKTPCRG